MRKALGVGARDTAEEHRSATPLELFTDLCYVVAIAQAAAQLHHEISDGHVVAGVLYFGPAFFAIWWAWLNFAWFNSAYDPDDVLHRSLTLLQIFGSLLLAAGIPRLFDGDFTLAVVGYVVMRVGLLAMWSRAAQGHPEGRTTAIRYALGLVSIQATWVIAVLVTHGRIPLPVVAFLVMCEVLVPVFAEAAGATPWHKHHIAERYGLMFIIVLGETILSVTFALQGAFDSKDPPATLWLVVVGGVLVTFSMWWLYFAREASRVLHHDRSGFVWGFGHYLVYGAVAALGAGLAVRVDFYTDHAQVGSWMSSAAVTVPAAVFIVTLWFTEVRPHDDGVRFVVVFGAMAAVVIGLTWVPAAEAWTGVAFLALLVLEASRRRAASM